MTRSSVLLTGATGFVGMAVLARLLERTDREVHTLVRAEGQEDADARMRGVLAKLFDDPHRHVDRVHAIPGDLVQPDLGLSIRARERIASEVDEIIHCGASVAFDLSLRESRAINVAGTSRMLGLAELCAARGGLRRMTYVSTAYVAGKRDDDVAEDELGVGQGFRNAYERSKHEAETMVRAHRERLPLTIVRPSIVVGESDTGWTSSFNVIYGPLRAFAAGTYPVLPGRRNALVDVVTVDYVADALLALSEAPEAVGGTYHLVSGIHASTLGEIGALASAHFGRPMPRLLPPTVYRTVVHPLVLRRSPRKARRVLKRSEVYFPYFSLNVRFDDRRARNLLAPLGIRPATLDRHFGRLLDFAEAARWGKNPIGRAQAQELARERLPRSLALLEPSVGDEVVEDHDVAARRRDHLPVATA
jgi:thioester reductase-like protein